MWSPRFAAAECPLDVLGTLEMGLMPPSRSASQSRDDSVCGHPERPLSATIDRSHRNVTSA